MSPSSHCWGHSWWRHQMETFSALLAICAGNSPVPGEFPTQRSVTRSFDVYFDLRPNKRLSKQLWGWWFDTQSRPLWRHRNVSLCTVIQSSLCNSFEGRPLVDIIYECPLFKWVTLTALKNKAPRKYFQWWPPVWLALFWLVALLWIYD